MKQTLNVKGMHCSSCEALIKDALADLHVDAKANHKTGTVDVSFDENTTTIDRIKDAIKTEGYEAD